MSIVDFPNGAIMQKPRQLAEVVTIYESNANDIVTMMRETADDIEESDDTGCVVCIRITDEGIVPYLWGKASTVEALGYLTLAKSIMSSVALGTDDD